MSDRPEKCQRCGDDGPDLRTLHMACFYAMDELGLPFDEYEVEGEDCPLVGEEVKPMFDGGPSMRIPRFSKPTDNKKAKYKNHFFTLRVCKSCRAEWMGAIKNWFNIKPAARESCGSGIFIRENGALKEITDDEWYAKNPNREPVRVKKP